MSAEAVKEPWAEFDDLASKSQNEEVQFLIRAMKLHAEVMDTRLSALEALVNTSANPNFDFSNGRNPRQAWVSAIFGGYHVAM